MIAEREKAEARDRRVREMMMRRPACKDMRWDRIREDLYDIYEEAGDGQWMCGTDWDRLCEAVDWDDEILYEFRIAFSDLAGQCRQMQEDMDALREMEREVFYGVEDEDWSDPPALFDLFFPAIDMPGEIWGYDVHEHDYYGFKSAWDEDEARKQARKRLMRLTKEQLIKLSGLCLEIARQYMSLISRHDALSSVLAILRREEEARLKTIVRLEELYEKANAETDGFEDWKCWGSKAMKDMDILLAEMPDRLWIE